VKYFNFIAAVFLSLLYITVRIPPTGKFNLWITNFIIPGALVINHILLVASLLMRKKSSLYYVGALLVGIPFLFGTIGLKSYFKSHQAGGKTFTVLNYNIGSFHMRPHAYKNIDSARVVLKNWMLNSEADIRCYQEFSNYPWSKEFNVISQLNKKGLHYYFSQEERPRHVEYSTTGVLIISKFPIIASGDLLASENGFNRIAYADINIDGDTVRIINVHLESMGLGQFDPRNANDLGSVKSTTGIILSKLKEGVFERSNQIRQLSDFIGTSPYPVVCAGDFNDMPYSYSYQFLKKTLKNTFEELGKGFGFTYRGETLKVLRIDNQFFTPDIEAVGFETMYDIKLSDHYPLKGEYQIKD
jgi:endonuclease/exonuclease/phosphatase family metal-dependent hydrolase